MPDCRTVNIVQVEIQPGRHVSRPRMHYREVLNKIITDRNSAHRNLLPVNQGAF